MTFDQLLTPAGMATASALIVTLVQIIKTALPAVDARVSGALLAFVFSAILYVVAALVLGGAADAYLQTFAAWVLVAAGAIGIKSGTDHVSAQATPPPAP